MGRRLAVSILVAVCALSGVACSDEDGDGAVTDEEAGEIEETIDSLGSEIEEEIDRGAEETGSNGG